MNSISAGHGGAFLVPRRQRQKDWHKFEANLISAHYLSL